MNDDIEPTEMSDRAVDRRELAKTMLDKTSKWPRTDRRVNRIRRILERRQPDLTIVLENVHDTRNISAVLRSCDAVGILRVHTIYTVEEAPESAYARKISGSAAKWIEVERHQSVAGCYDHLRASGFRILATALTERSLPFYSVDLTKPVALVFGNEHRGVTDEAVELADGTVEIPMLGMIESLNISVACAVTLYEASRQRAEQGAYDTPKLPADVLERYVDEWSKR